MRKTLYAPTNYELVYVKIPICENSSACDVINLAVNNNKPHEALNSLQEILPPITPFLSAILFSPLSSYYSLNDINYAYNPFLSATLKFFRKYLMLFLMWTRSPVSHDFSSGKNEKDLHTQSPSGRINKPIMIGVMKNRLYESACE